MTTKRKLDYWKRKYESGAKVEFKCGTRQWELIRFWNLHQFPELTFEFRLAK